MGAAPSQLLRCSGAWLMTRVTPSKSPTGVWASRRHRSGEHVRGLGRWRWFGRVELVRQFHCFVDGASADYHPRSRPKHLRDDVPNGRMWSFAAAQLYPRLEVDLVDITDDWIDSELQAGAAAATGTRGGRSWLLAQVVRA